MPRKTCKARKHRTSYRTSKGNKRYLKRNAKGQIIDNQSAKRCSQLDQKKSSKAERAKAARKKKK